MKNQRIFSAIGFFFVLFLIMGCEKEPSGEPTTENPNIKPTISVDMIPEDGIVDFGGDVTFLFAVSVNTKKMTINGEGVTLPISTYVAPDVKTNTTFVFIVENDAGRTVRTKNIVVRDQVFSLPAITLTSTPDTLPIGGGITTLSWVGQYVDSVLIEDVWHIGSSGSIQIERYSTSTVSALAKGKGGETTATSSVYVLKMDNLLNSGTWTYAQGDFTDTLGVFMWTFFEWENSIPCQQDDEMTFTMNPNIFNIDFGIQCTGENFPSTTCSWTLNENDSTFMLGGYTRIHKIISITNDILVYTISSFSDNGDGTWTPILVKNTYKHLP